MHTYDPSDGIVYVHLLRDVDPGARAVQSIPSQNRLPRGYANASLRTRLLVGNGAIGAAPPAVPHPRASTTGPADRRPLLPLTA